MRLIDGRLPGCQMTVHSVHTTSTQRTSLCACASHLERGWEMEVCLGFCALWMWRTEGAEEREADAICRCEGRAGDTGRRRENVRARARTRSDRHDTG
jgi:hypothetical protein